LEKYSSGRRGAPAKGIGRVTGARVQIPLSPLLFAIYVVRIFLKKLLTNDRRFDRISKLSETTTHQLERVEKRKIKKLLTSTAGYDNITELLKTTKNIDN
jgi:hypothetical protein